MVRVSGKIIKQLTQNKNFDYEIKEDTGDIHIFAKKKEDLCELSTIIYTPSSDWGDEFKGQALHLGVDKKVLTDDAYYFTIPDCIFHGCDYNPNKKVPCPTETLYNIIKKEAQKKK